MNKTLERLVMGGVALLIGLLLGWMVRGVATYRTAMETSTPYDDWRVVCAAANQKDGFCEISQDIMDANTRATVARIGLTRDKDGQVLGFTLPFDVSLEQGIGLQIGKDPVKVYKYRTCNTVGCIVVAPVDGKLMASLDQAKDVKLLFLGIQPGAKPVAMPISMKGFITAHRAYLSDESKRTNWFWRLWS